MRGTLASPVCRLRTFSVLFQTRLAVFEQSGDELTALDTIHFLLGETLGRLACHTALTVAVFHGLCAFFTLNGYGLDFGATFAADKRRMNLLGMIFEHLYSKQRETCREDADTERLPVTRSIYDDGNEENPLDLPCDLP